MVVKWDYQIKQKFISTFALLVIFSQITPPAVADIDLQADLNRIVTGIQNFDANSAATSSVTTLAEIRVIFSNNALILKQISQANATFKRDLNVAKSQIPNRDTKASPAFSTLMNLTRGYEEWVRYQDFNQLTAQKCLSSAKNSYDSFSNCLIVNFQKTMENERIGKMKLQSAWNAWKKWQVKYGYA